INTTLLVVDAMTGQEAVNVAQTFNEKIGIDGIVLSKLDGDSRGGAALSAKAVTGKPIIFAGMGEKLTDLEPFYPDRMASRILGMGDVLTLIDKAVEAQQEADEEKERQMAAKLKKGTFDFNMYLESMKQMRSMGGLGGILNMLPGMGKISYDQLPDEKELARMEAIVLSMTPRERENPKILSPQRKYRIAKGSGNDIAVVNRFIKQFEQTQKMMKQMGGMKRGRHGMGGLGGLMGGMPGMGRRGKYF
ncbi:MAG: signal recognition particle protein, partial [Lachnospiraceae bacterium]|nr:signal recognition particle protein [Lachnospiraceae bacterium]